MHDLLRICLGKIPQNNHRFAWSWIPWKWISHWMTSAKRRFFLLQVTLKSSCPVIGNPWSVSWRNKNSSQKSWTQNSSQKKHFFFKVDLLFGFCTEVLWEHRFVSRFVPSTVSRDYGDLIYPVILRIPGFHLAPHLVGKWNIIPGDPLLAPPNNSQGGHPHTAWLLRFHVRNHDFGGLDSKFFHPVILRIASWKFSQWLIGDWSNLRKVFRSKVMLYSSCLAITTYDTYLELKEPLVLFTHKKTRITFELQAPDVSCKNYFKKIFQLKWPLKTQLLNNPLTTPMTPYGTHRAPSRRT